MLSCRAAYVSHPSLACSYLRNCMQTSCLLLKALAHRPQNRTCCNSENSTQRHLVPETIDQTESACANVRKPLVSLLFCEQALGRHSRENERHVSRAAAWLGTCQGSSGMAVCDRSHSTRRSEGFSICCSHRSGMGSMGSQLILLARASPLRRVRYAYVKRSRQSGCA